MTSNFLNFGTKPLYVYYDIINQLTMYMFPLDLLHAFDSLMFDWWASCSVSYIIYIAHVFESIHNYWIFFHDLQCAKMIHTASMMDNTTASSCIYNWCQVNPLLFQLLVNNMDNEILKTVLWCRAYILCSCKMWIL